MKIRDLPDWVETEFEFPTTTAQVIDRAGDVEIEAPDQPDSETLATILDRAGETTYQSRANLLDAIRGNLTDEYIGRKYYDDRGHNPEENDREHPPDTADKSF